jgi:hypothetical protein
MYPRGHLSIQFVEGPQIHTCGLLDEYIFVSHKKIDVKMQNMGRQPSEHLLLNTLFKYSFVLLTIVFLE